MTSTWGWCVSIQCTMETELPPTNLCMKHCGRGLAGGLILSSADLAMQPIECCLDPAAVHSHGSTLQERICCGICQHSCSQCLSCLVMRCYAAREQAELSTYGVTAFGLRHLCPHQHPKKLSNSFLL